MILPLVSTPDIAAARALIVGNELVFEDRYDELFGIFEGETLIATGARDGFVLKMLAIDAAHQGGALLGELVTAMILSARQAGHDAVFVYTKPEYITSFKALNFSLLASQERAVLMEFGRGLPHWLAANQALVRKGSNGAVVVNCNPFTAGHRYLIETAARRVDTLYVFVVREDRSIFPFAARYRLVIEGTSDLDNVVVLDTSRYIVSSATFPTYFLKKDDPVARIQMELDVALFAAHIAPFFGITRRYAGTEPCCALTAAYNATMRHLLPRFGIEFIEIERITAAAGVISASRVRALMAQNDSSGLAELVPDSTRAYLASPEAEAIREELSEKHRS